MDRSTSALENSLRLQIKELEEGVAVAQVTGRREITCRSQDHFRSSGSHLMRLADVEDLDGYRGQAGD
jgi:hypothetical protein